MKPWCGLPFRQSALNTIEKRKWICSNRFCIAQFVSPSQYPSWQFRKEVLTNWCSFPWVHRKILSFFSFIYIYHTKIHKFLQITTSSQETTTKAATQLAIHNFLPLPVGAFTPISAERIGISFKTSPISFFPDSKFSLSYKIFIYGRRAAQAAKWASENSFQLFFMFSRKILEISWAVGWRIGIEEMCVKILVEKFMTRIRRVSKTNFHSLVLFFPENENFTRKFYAE